jgi:hypothetical protein
MKEFLYLLVFIVLIAACSKDDDNNKNNHNFNPTVTSFLTVGHQWSYEYNIVMEGITLSGETSFNVIEDMGNGTYKVSQTTQMAGTPSQTMEHFWTEDDAFGMGMNLENVQVGDNWIEIDEGVTYTTTVVSISENVTVPAGSFNCIKMKGTQSDEPSITNYYYYNKSYGMILSDITVKEDDQGVVYEMQMVMKLKSKNF